MEAIVKPEVFTKFQKRPGLSHINRLFYFTLHRCVPDNQRSYSLGFQFIFQRSLGFMPGPVVTGWIFDYLCLLWGESCGKRGRCQIYDIKKLSLAITVLGCIMKGKVSASKVTAIIDRINTGQLLIFSVMEDKKHSTLFRSICNCMRFNLLCIKQTTLNLCPFSNVCITITIPNSLQSYGKHLHDVKLHQRLITLNPIKSKAEGKFFWETRHFQ